MPQNSPAVAHSLSIGADQIIGTGWYASASGAGAANQNFQKVVILPFGGSDISFEFNNSGGNAEGGSSGLTFAVSVSLTPTGTPIPVTIGGAATYTFIAGTKARIRTDPLYGYNFLPMQTIYVQIYADPTGSAALPINMPCQTANGDRWQYSNSHAETNQTLNGAYAYGGQGNPQVYLYGFSAIFGKLASWVPSIGCIGNSLTVGIGENAGLPGLGYIGWVNRAFNGVLPSSVLGQTGELAITTNTYTASNIRRAITNRCTKFINELCINDIIGSSTLAVVQASVIQNAVLAHQAGAQVWQVTPTPNTTGTFTTLAGQVLGGNDAVRVAFSVWIRNGAPMVISGSTYTPAATGSTAANVLRMRQKGHPMFSYIDVETICIDATSGKWQPGATTDGIHPTSVYHALIAASITKTTYPLLFTMAY